jgi:hypothetical protein
LAARRFFAAARIASSSSFLRASAFEMVLPALSVVHSPSDSVSASDAGASMRSTSRARSASAAARAAFFDAFEGFAAASSSFFEFLLAFLPASLPCFLGILAYCTYRGLEAVRWHQAIVTLLARAGE